MDRRLKFLFVALAAVIHGSLGVTSKGLLNVAATNAYSITLLRAIVAFLAGRLLGGGDLDQGVAEGRAVADVAQPVAGERVDARAVAGPVAEAKALGLTIPPSVRAQADKVIE